MINKLIENFPQEIVDDAIRLHRHLAPGIILGFKMALFALKELAPKPGDVVILTSETTRCIPDGIQALARYLLVHGGYHVYLRTYDVGKLSMQVTINHEYKKDFRIVLNEDYLEENKEFYAWVYLDKDKQLELDALRDVMWEIDLDRAFTKVKFKKKIKPEFKGKQIIDCPSCGESTSKLSMIEHKGKLTCKTCVFFDRS